MRFALPRLTAVAAISLVAIALTAQPASAATLVVTTFDELQASVAAPCGDNTVVLGADFSAGTVNVSCTTTIDLAGFSLDSNSVNLATATTLTLEDTVGGGEWRATATVLGTAGIRTTNATLVVTGGSVIANGAPVGAGIGGNNGGDGGTVTVLGGSVAAYGGDLATGIGGGGGVLSRAGSGGSVFIGEGADVTAVGYRGSAIGGGSGSITYVFGSLTVAGTLHLPAGQMRVGDSNAAGPEVTVSETGQIVGGETDLTVGASLVGDGQIDNRGVIALASVGISVLSNSYDVSFDAQDGSAPSVTRVFGPSFQAGYRAIPAPPAGAEWATAPDGSGSLFTAATTLASASDTTPKPVSLFAVSGFLLFQMKTGSCAQGAMSLTEDLTGETFVVNCDLTLDLAGHVLTVQYVNVNPGATLTLDDTVGGGILRADPELGPRAEAAIGVPDGAGLVVRGGTVDAVGWSGSAIGGDDPGVNGESAGSITVTGGTVTARSTFAVAIGGGSSSAIGGNGATMLVTGGTVMATSPSGVAIGGGADGSTGGSLRIEGGSVTASGRWGIGSPYGFGAAVDIVSGELTVSGTESALGGSKPSSFGSLNIRMAGTMFLPSGPVLIPDADPSGAEILIEDGGRLFGTPDDPTQGATISGDGQIDNGGVIALAEALVGVTVLQNNYLLTFDSDELLEPAPVRVFAPSVASGYRVLPAAPTNTDWNESADGAGGWFTDTTPIAADTTLYARTDATLVFEDAPGSVEQSGAITFVITGTDHQGNPVDTSNLVLTSSVPTDEIDGLTVTFPHASPHTITATLGTVSTATTVEVIPTPAPPAPAPAPPSATGSLSSTGGTFDPTLPVGLAAIMLLLGFWSTVRGIRRRSSAG